MFDLEFPAKIWFVFPISMKRWCQAWSATAVISDTARTSFRGRRPRSRGVLSKWRYLKAVSFVAIAWIVVACGKCQVDQAPCFDLPVACPTGIGCIVRNFVDQDPGPGAMDFRCGRLTYDGHKGTDIRVPDGASISGGIAVLAAAPGTVLRVRDGMEDVSVRVTGVEAVRNRDAGNSVVIDHGGGWETQYGHMRKGSIAVRPADRVVAGQTIGLIGLSGNTEFTHVHFEVRHNGIPIDPYTGKAMGCGCGKDLTPLWTDTAMTSLVYREDAPFDAGFATKPPDPWAARAGAWARTAISVESEALIFWIDVLGHRIGDRQVMRLIGPDGAVLDEATDTADETWVQWFQFIGKKRPATGWPAGRYRGEYTLTRNVDGLPRIVVYIRREIEVQ